MNLSSFDKTISPRGILLCAAIYGVATTSHAAVTISSGETQNMSCSAGVCAPTASDAVLNVTDMENLLSSGNLEITTTGSGVQADDIDIVAPFSWTDGNSLTLDAYRSITVTQSVADNGSGGVVLAANDGGNGGALSFQSGGSLSFATPASALSINGKTYVLEDSVATLAAAIASNPSGHYALSASYDASQDGVYSNSPILNKLNGTVNGLGNAISNLQIASDTRFALGLFTRVGKKGEIDSLLVTNSDVSIRDGKRNFVSVAGVLSATNHGTIFNAFASGELSYTVSKLHDQIGAGGLIGSNDGKISASGADVTVAANVGRGFAQVGGLVAVNLGSGIVEGSYATGSAASNTVAGGLVAFNDGLVENCYALGDSSVSINSYVGGLAGATDTAIGASYSTGKVSGGSGSSVGGFVGGDDSDGELSGNYWDTTTSGIANPGQGAGNIANDPGISAKTTKQLEKRLPKGFRPENLVREPADKRRLTLSHRQSATMKQ